MSIEDSPLVGVSKIIAVSGMVVDIANFWYQSGILIQMTTCHYGDSTNRNIKNQHVHNHEGVWKRTHHVRLAFGFVV